LSTNAASASHAYTNRLAREKSPYLLQHAHNPVDWFAWGEEAFGKARAEQKPVFLSIGYSTCHWCHVMERESFEREETAKFLNEHFVSIKVDREERPDVDKIYMTFVQSTTGSGGWPLNVFLTPDLKPFFGGTYFPPDHRYGRGSFRSVLEQIVNVWRERHSEVAASADEIHTRLEVATSSATASNQLLTVETLRRAGALFKEAYDPQHGGFGGAPKFPQPSQPAFLLRYAKRFHDDEAAKMILHTCDAMAAGGIHDQLGGGFARYSVDAEWLVPHFEKMLYDNAQLAQLYLDAHLVSEGRVTRTPDSASGNREGLVKLVPPESPYAEVARDILDYVLRDMAHPDGGFYSAEDADSEGHEGKFYCWTRAELSKLLSPEEFNVTARYFGITEKGNFVDHSHPTPLAGQNVLNVVEPLSRPDGHPLPIGRGEGRERGASVSNDHALLASAKKKMFAARAKRIRPHLDDKILASWNGLMLGAFARAYAVLGEEKYLAAAEKNLAFVREKLWVSGGDGGLSVALPLTPALSPGERENRIQSPGKLGAESSLVTAGISEGGDWLFPLPKGEGQGEGKRSVGTLFHRWRDGERDSVQLLEAYAFQLDGVIQLYEATLEPKHLDFAIALAEAMVAKFYDMENGGFWQSSSDAKDLILRVKDDYDGAEPSGNSVATLALLKLAAITDREDFKKPSEATLRLFATRLEKTPQAVPYMLHALDFWLEEPRRVVIAGDPHSAKARELLHAAHSVYQPDKIVLGNNGAVGEFARTLPACGDEAPTPVSGRRPTKEGPVVYFCTGKACQPPTQDDATVREMLK
jgi:uncharacterized protein YyaL (SSP411 family)